MVVQKLSEKVLYVESVKEISACFNICILNITKDFDEVKIVFDTYRIDSFKNRRRQKRRKGNDPVQ